MSVHNDDQMSCTSDVTYCEAVEVELARNLNGLQLAPRDTNNTTQLTTQETNETVHNMQLNDVRDQDDNSQELELHSDCSEVLVGDSQLSYDNRKFERFVSMNIDNEDLLVVDGTCDFQEVQSSTKIDTEMARLTEELVEVSANTVMDENSAGENTELNFSNQLVNIVAYNKAEGNGKGKGAAGSAFSEAVGRNVYLKRLRSRPPRKTFVRKPRKKSKLSAKQTVISDFYGSDKIFIAQPFESKVNDEIENISNGISAPQDNPNSTNDDKKHISNLEKAVAMMKIAKANFLQRLLDRKQELLSAAAAASCNHNDGLNKKKSNVYAVEEFTLSTEEALQNMNFLCETAAYYEKICKKAKYQ